MPRKGTATPPRQLVLMRRVLNTEPSEDEGGEVKELRRWLEENRKEFWAMKTRLEVSLKLTKKPQPAAARAVTGTGVPVEPEDEGSETVLRLIERLLKEAGNAESR